MRMLRVFCDVCEHQSEFVSVEVTIDTSGLSGHLVPLVPLYRELLLNLPLNDNGVEISQDDAVRALNEMATDFWVHSGFSSAFDTLLSCAVKVKKGKYSDAIKLLHLNLKHALFPVERIQDLRSTTAWQCMFFV